MTGCRGRAMMDSVAPRPVAHLVGRQDSLELLAAALQRAERGLPSITVVSGETGVGKTRVVGEFLKRSEAISVVGACVPVAGEALPFAALAQGLRRLRAGNGREIVEASPELMRLLPGDGLDDQPIGTFHQLRLFQAVLTLLDHLGRRRPVVWVIEDLHWADRATLDLVRFVASNLTRERAFVVITYRLEEVTRHSPMQAWLAELRRLPRVDHIGLARLGRDEAVQLVRALARAESRETPADLLESIVTRADGNPLFAQHLVWQSDHAGGPLPAALSDLLGSRLAALPAPGRALVAAASVLARPVPLELLAATCSGLAPEAGLADLAAAEEAVQSALERHVLRITREDLVEFHHPAIREVAYGELLSTRRAALHRAAAQALVSGIAGGESAPGEVARHWHLAGDLPRALDSALEAGYAAEKIPAFADVYANLVRALELADRLGRDIDRIDVLRHAARAAQLVGDEAEAMRLLERALGLAHDDHVRASLLEELGHVHLMAGRGPEAEAALRDALALLPPDEESALLAAVYAGLALLTAAWSHHEDAEWAARQALRVARAVGDRREEGRAHNALGLLACSRGDYDEAVDHMNAALRAAHASGNVDDMATYVNLTHVLGLAGRHEEVVAVAAEGIDAITRLGLARQTGTLLMANLAESLIKLGRYAEAQEVVDHALGLNPRGIVAAPTLLRAARLCLLRGDTPSALRHVERARAVVELEEAPIAWYRDVTEGLAEVELWAGHAAKAYDIVLAGLHAVRGTDAGSCSWLLCLGLRALGDLAQSHRQPAAKARHEQMRRDILDLAPPAQGPATGGDPPEAPAWTATAAAEDARAQDRHAPQLWAQAARSWDDCDRPFEAAYALWREAEARLGERVDEAAIAALRAADARAREVGIVPIVDEVGNLATWYRVDLLPQSASPAVLPAGSTASGSDDSIGDYALTPREVEVLECLAAGRTNQEIASHLGISIKTASVHVSNILRKFDVPSRQDAARMAHRLGVLG